MVVDTSAILAILFREAEEPRLLTAIAGTEGCTICPVNWAEALMVAESRQGEDAANRLLLIIAQLQIGLATVDSDTAWLAHSAWRRFGKGRHPAGLNMGDCWAYAAARQRGQPLMYKGNDFSKTDVVSAIW